MTTIFHSGPILTMTEADDRPEAVLVAGSRIQATGTLPELRELAGHGAEEVDLDGRALLPGFIDSHGHLLMHGMLATQVDLEDATSIDEIVTRLAARLVERDPSDMSALIGVKYDPALLTDGRHPTRQELDRVSTDLPVYIAHRSLHVGAANTHLLDLAGLGASTPDPLGGRFGREENGALNGYVEELPAIEILARALSPDGSTGLVPGLHVDTATAARTAVEDYLAHGITTAQEGAADPDSVRRLAEIADSDGLGLDLVVYPLVTEETTCFEDLPRFASDYRGGMRLGGYKIVLDGSPQARSAWMSDPYEPLSPGDEPDCAYPIHTDETVAALVQRAVRENRQLIVHCNGDAAAEQWISALETATADHPEYLETRPVMIHAQTVREDQIARMAVLNMTASVFAVHTWFWGDVHLRNFGAERGRNISPTRWVLDAGVALTLHQDVPVTPPDMILTLWAATNRITRGGREIGPHQRLTVWEALRAVTLDAAHQYGEESKKGSLEAGKLADFVVLSADPTAVEASDLRKITVEATYKRGAKVFARRS